MSNNIKKIGLDYFSIDTDIFSDEKMQYITAKFGVKGEAIIFRLMARIYRQGYYYQWNEDQCLLLSMSTGGSATAELIHDVVEEAAKRSFFDPVMLNDYGILTSRRIQTHYLFSTRRRKVVDIMSTFMMVDDQDVNIVGDNVNIKPLKVDREGTKHRTVKHRTEKNSKEYINASETQAETEEESKIDNKDKKVKKTTTPKLSLTETQLNLIELLKSKILENNPGAKISDTYQNTWGKDLEKMMRLDGRTADQVRAVILWSQASDFWCSNIMSFDKLRKQFDKLTMQMKRGGNHGYSDPEKHKRGF